MDDRGSHERRGGRRPYVTGFLLSVALSVVPFILVMTSAFPRVALLVAIGTFAVAQVGTHLVFFLHLGRPTEPRWNVAVLLYTVVVLAILVGASVWIMYHLDANMMGEAARAP